ncbi:AAA family ATPase [Gordonia iterans]
MSERDDSQVVPVPGTGAGTGTTLVRDGGSGTSSVPGDQPEQPIKTPEFYDVAALLAGTMPEPPAPTVLRRDDEVGLLYAGYLNLLFGDPESGKTWLMLCALAEVLRDGGSALMVDLDHNGGPATVARLLALGVSTEVLGDLTRFAYIEPEDTLALREVVVYAQHWQPTFIGIDSMGELLPMFGKNSNSGDEYTHVHSQILKPLVRTGACVVVIDHLAKGAGSRASGPTGSPAKRRTIGGVSLRVKVSDAFTPGHGGKAYVSINKDRNGGLRAATRIGEGEPLAAVFSLKAEKDDRLSYTLRAPRDDERAPEDSRPDLVAQIAALSPPPKSANDAHTRIGGQRQAALNAFKVWKGEGGTGSEPGTGNQYQCSICEFPMSDESDRQAGHHVMCEPESEDH